MACEQHDVILEKLKTVIERLDKTEKETRLNTKDIQYLKEHKVSNEEKFERVFELLAELKDTLSDIQQTIKEKNERLPTLVYSVAGMVIGGSLSGLIVFLVTK